MDWDDTPLMKAVESGDIEACKDLLEAGADIGAWDNILLFTAVRAGNAEMCQFLLENGADDPDGSILDMSQEYNNAEITKLLNMYKLC